MKVFSKKAIFFAAKIEVALHFSAQLIQFY